LVLVTGATGFLGSHLVCRLLADGQVVRACKRNTSDTKEFNFVFHHYFPDKNEQLRFSNNLVWVQTDVLELDTLAEAIIGVEWVYHCAALVSFEAADSDLLMDVNAQGTANVVNLCLLNGVKNLCYVSSIASLGRIKSGNTMDENSKWESSKLNSNYAISKYRAELEVWRGSVEGLNVIIVNPGVIIGIGDFKKGSNSLVHTIYKGLPLYSMGVNGYVDVKDVARAMILLVQSKIRNQRFVLVGSNLSIRDLFFMLADGFQKKRPSILVTPFLAGVSWRVMKVVRIFYKKGIAITKETARASVNESYYNSNKIIKELSFTFTPIENTVKECCAAYLTTIKNNI
jgi:nucleoside-diphosphate-sugar epimerase